MDKKIVIPRMDLVVTTKCSLRCESCANLMQYYEEPNDVPLDIIYESMIRLTNAVDEIEKVYVLGGEPFLYKELWQVVSFLAEMNNINEIIVVTNGTVCPDNRKMWEVFRNSKVTIRISNYGKLSRNINLLVEKCLREGVKYIREDKGFFYDTGNMNKRNRTDEVLNRVFEDCATQCRSLFMGEFHFCPRSAHGTDLGIVMKRESDYVNLLGEESIEKIRWKIDALINRKNYILACDYCDIRTPGYYERKIPLAKQTKIVLKAERE